MDFTHRKLMTEAAIELKRVPVSQVSAYTIQFFPLYVFMKLNKKFVAVKSPLDFFIPAELEKFKAGLKVAGNRIDMSAELFDQRLQDIQSQEKQKLAARNGAKQKKGK